MGRSVKGNKRGKKTSSSPYNVFFTRELKRLKEQNPEMSHKDAFKQAGLNWRTSLENPKNKSKASAVSASDGPVPGPSANAPAPLVNKNATPATATTVEKAASVDRAQAMLPTATAGASVNAADSLPEAQNSGTAEKRPTPIGGSALPFHASPAPFQAPAAPGSAFSAESVQIKTHNVHASQEATEKMGDGSKQRSAERKDSAASSEGNVPAIPSMASHTVVTSTTTTIAAAK